MSQPTPARTCVDCLIALLLGQVAGAAGKISRACPGTDQPFGSIAPPPPARRPVGVPMITRRGRSRAPGRRGSWSWCASLPPFGCAGSAAAVGVDGGARAGADVGGRVHRRLPQDGQGCGWPLGSMPAPLPARIPVFVLIASSLLVVCARGRLAAGAAAPLDAGAAAGCRRITPSGRCRRPRRSGRAWSCSSVPPPQPFGSSCEVLPARTFVARFIAASSLE